MLDFERIPVMGDWVTEKKVVRDCLLQDLFGGYWMKGYRKKDKWQIDTRFWKDWMEWYRVMEETMVGGIDGCENTAEVL